MWYYANFLNTDLMQSIVNGSANQTNVSICKID